MRIKTFRLFEEDYDNDSGAAFWGNRGAGILPICKTSGRILLAMRSDAVNEPNTWGIFGGKIDNEHETPEEAARRELREETGYKKHFEVIPAFVFKTSGFTYSNFLGIVETEFKPRLDWETAYTEWVSLRELMSIEPKHFGLEGLIEHSIELIKSYAR